MKERMFKYFSANSTRRYIDVLGDMVNHYNNARHSSIKMSLVEAGDKKNETNVWMNLYPDFDKPKETINPKFSLVIK